MQREDRRCSNRTPGFWSRWRTLERARGLTEVTFRELTTSFLHYFPLLKRPSQQVLTARREKTLVGRVVLPLCSASREWSSFLYWCSDGYCTAPAVFVLFGRGLRVTQVKNERKLKRLLENNLVLSVPTRRLALQVQHLAYPRPCQMSDDTTRREKKR